MSGWSKLRAVHLKGNMWQKMVTVAPFLSVIIKSERASAAPGVRTEQEDDILKPQGDTIAGSLGVFFLLIPCRAFQENHSLGIL